jgi:predicted amidohydrolase YtcJ
MPADTLLTHLTCPALPNITSIAIQNGKILELGTDLSHLVGPQTRTLELNGACVLPGFNDAHVHIWKVGQLRTTSLDLRDCDTLLQVYALVQERLETLPVGTWLLGRGWNEAKLGGNPTRAALDALSQQHPILLTRTCAHIHAVNSLALERAGIVDPSQAPAGGEIRLEEGLLLETAYGLVLRAIPEFTQADYERWILAGCHYLRSLGITSATDPAVDPPLLAAYRALEAGGQLPIRVNVLYIRRPDGGDQTFPLPEKYVSDFLRCDSVKFFADGGLSGATAAVSEPYINLGNEHGPASTGILRFETEELYPLMLEAHQAGFRIGTHAIGDVALEQVLNIYQRLYQEHPLELYPELKHRIEHFGLATPQQLEQAKAMNLFVVPQPIFLQELGHNFKRYLSQKSLERCYALGSFAAAGLNMAFSTDGPVVKNLNPLSGIQTAVNAVHYGFSTAHQVTLGYALRAYTEVAAAAQGDENNRGRLEPGYWADLVILERNPFEVPPLELDRVRVLGTWVGGRD